MIIDVLPANQNSYMIQQYAYELLNKILYHILNFNTLRIILFKVSASFSEAIHGLEVLGHPDAAGPLLHHTLYLASHIIVTDHMVQFLQSLLCVCWENLFNFSVNYPFMVVFIMLNKEEQNIHYK